MFLFGKSSNHTHSPLGFYAFICHKYLPSPGLVVSSKYEEMVEVLRRMHYKIRDGDQAINN